MLVGFIRSFYAGYSLGASKSELEKYAAMFGHYLPKQWNIKGGSYNDMLFALSTSIIFDITRHDVKPITDLLISEKYKDFVLDSMSNYLISDFEIRTDELKFKKSIKPLADIIRLSCSDKVEAVNRLKYYLDKEWLNKHKDGIICNTDHLLDEVKFKSYVGYWCIESAALVIMLGLDDSVLKDCRHYPYDLVHG